MGPTLEFDGNAFQRILVLTKIPELIAEFNVDIQRVIERLPVDASVFADASLFIPYGLALEILDACARETKCAEFGLLLGARCDYKIMGAIGPWLETAPNLLTALEGFVSLQPANSRGAAAYLRRSENDFIFGYGIYDRTAVAHNHSYAAFMAVAANTVRALTAGKVRPSEVLFAFRRPPDAARYESTFGAPIRFNQLETGLVLSRQAMETPVFGAKGDAADFWRRLAAPRTPPSPQIWSDRVKHLIRPLLAEGQVSAAAVAAILNVNVRTLARRLAAEGGSFKAILEEVRFATARELLALTDLSAGDIAEALCYATHAAFDVAFLRWSGMAPTAWRAATMGAGSATAGAARKR